LGLNKLDTLLGALVARTTLSTARKSLEDRVGLWVWLQGL
jgi:hypothetical protein